MPLKVNHGTCDLWPLCRQINTTVWKTIDGGFKTFCRECWFTVYREYPS